jgi:AcrR family transcriptional regulator
MIDAACSCGAANVTVGDVVRRAGVSRRTFYELFAGVEDCLLASLEKALHCASSYLREAYDPQAPWPTRVRSALVALLSFLDDEPAMGRLLVVESLYSGPRALSRRAAVLAELASEIDSGRSERSDGFLSPLAAEGTVGSIVSLVHTRIIAEHQPMLDLASPLMAMIALPYLGPAAARRELARPAPKQAPASRPTPTGHERLNGLPMRITYRTMAVLGAIASRPGASNRQIGVLAGISDQGQISKLLRRLARLGLVEKTDRTMPGTLNAWVLTPRGAEVHRAVNPLSDGTSALGGVATGVDLAPIRSPGRD